MQNGTPQGVCTVNMAWGTDIEAYSFCRATQAISQFLQYPQGVRILKRIVFAERRRQGVPGSVGRLLDRGGAVRRASGSLSIYNYSKP